MANFDDIKEFGSDFLGMGNPKQVWTLKMIDPPKTEFQGQYIAENAVENISQKLSSVSSVGSAQPNIQYIRNEGETFQFTARVFAEHSGQNILEKIQILKSFVRKNPDLNRSPLFIFNFGLEISFKCFVQSLGGIRYDEPRQDGSLRGAILNIELVKTEIEEDAKAVAMSAAAQAKQAIGIGTAVLGVASAGGLIDIPGGSLHTIDKQYTAKNGDTYESISATEYGSAEHGDILRRIHPSMRDLKPNDKVTLVVKNELLSIIVTPQSTALQRDKDAINMRKEKFELRSKSKTIFV